MGLDGVCNAGMSHLSLCLASTMAAEYTALFIPVHVPVSVVSAGGRGCSSDEAKSAPRVPPSASAHAPCSTTPTPGLKRLSFSALYE